MLKSPKQLPNSTEYSKKGVFLIVFKDILYKFRAYTVTVSYCSLTTSQVPEKLY